MYMAHDLYCVTIAELQRRPMPQPDELAGLCSKLRTERSCTIVD